MSVKSFEWYRCFEYTEFRSYVHNIENHSAIGDVFGFSWTSTCAVLSSITSHVQYIQEEEL